MYSPDQPRLDNGQFASTWRTEQEAELFDDIIEDTGGTLNNPPAWYSAEQVRNFWANVEISDAAVDQFLQASHAVDQQRFDVRYQQFLEENPEPVPETGWTGKPTREYLDAVREWERLEGQRKGEIMAEVEALSWIPSHRQTRQCIRGLGMYRAAKELSEEDRQRVMKIRLRMTKESVNLVEDFGAMFDKDWPESAIYDPTDEIEERRHQEAVEAAQNAADAAEQLREAAILAADAEADYNEVMATV